ncbi:hypothetical protein D9M71_156090 [compost metagenome]
MPGDPVVQLAIGIGMRAVEQGGRERAARGPVGAGLAVAAVDAAHRQHHHRRLQVDFGSGVLAHGHHAIDLAGLVLQRGDTMAVQHAQAAVAVGRAQGGDHASGQLAGGAPDDVITRQAVTVALQAALDPVHRRHEFHAFSQQPVVDLGA